MHNKPTVIDRPENVILFDGVCKLCNAWSQFIIRFDRKRAFKLGTVQSAAGQELLKSVDLPTEHFDTMVYIENGRSYERSDAFFKVMSKMGFPWRLICVFAIVPKALRDRMYDFIARNRYRFFGKYDQCLLPQADHAGRFLEERA